MVAVERSGGLPSEKYLLGNSLSPERKMAKLLLSAQGLDGLGAQIGRNVLFLMLPVRGHCTMWGGGRVCFRLRRGAWRVGLGAWRSGVLASEKYPLDNSLFPGGNSSKLLLSALGLDELGPQIRRNMTFLMLPVKGNCTTCCGSRVCFR